MGHNKLNPRSTRYEFFGPIGTSLVTIVSPLFLCFQYLICNEQGGCPANLSYVFENLFNLSNFITIRALKVYLGWLAYQLAMWYIIPGEWIKGTKLRNDQYQYYKMNAYPIFLITTLLALSFRIAYGFAPFLYIVDIYFELLVTSILFTFIMSLFLYINSFINEDNKLLALGGNTGSHIHDFFLGRELNPTIMNLDLKEFFELRPGLMGWAILNFCFMMKQIHLLNGPPTYSMIFVVLCQFFYVLDSNYNQSAVLTTMDITTDGFGFMLCFGDISWVPFFYSIQTRYLAFNPLEFSSSSIMLIIITASLGYYIFRGANGQKNLFRRDPNHPDVQHLEYLISKTGRKLLVTGWWGIASHINYLGDWLLSLSQCLACGFDSYIPYLFAGYFLILLIHRDSRDDHECSKKYGSTWVQYRKIVPYRIIPYVY